MLKTLGWLAVGMVSGAVAVFWLRPASELTDASAGVAFSSGTGTALAVERDELADRVAELEEQVSGLTRALDGFDERLSEEAERVDSEVAAHAAALREIEQRLAAISPGGSVPGGPQGGAAAMSGWVFTDRNAAVAVTPESAAAASAAGQPLPAPTNLHGIEALPGETLIFRVTGSTDGSVWGTDSYTDDSSIAAAAVHAGVLRPGESGTVMLIVQSGLPTYTGSSRYGVDSSKFGEWERSFAIQRLY